MSVETASQGVDSGCYHCGSPVPKGATWQLVIDERPRSLCCPGCEAVAQAITASGLSSYYRFRTELPERPANDAGTRRVQAETWQVFDDPALQGEFVHADGDGLTATLTVDGITCAACAWLIEHRLNALDGVTSSAVNLSHHRLSVSWDPARLKLSALLAELAAIGYPAQPYAPDQAQQQLKHDERMGVRRLIVAAVAMMQVMMFSVPIYLSGPDEMSRDFLVLFHWLSFALATPVVFFSAAPFFHNALRDLRNRTLGMDVPVSLAIGGAYLASGYAVIAGHGEIYFDSVSMFTFFLLFGRYVEMRARRRSGHSGNALAGVMPASATRLEADDSERVLPANRLVAGDRVLVRPGHGVPADGVIEDGTSSLDESMLTGESRPVIRRVGDAVIGGSHNIDSPLVVRVTHAGGEARASAILNLTDRAFAKRPRIAELASRWAHLFVIRLLVVSLGVAIAWAFIDPSRALWVTLSVLVVTCPCALALATPTALTASHGRLRRRGFLITRAHALEGLAQAKRVILDKTGTLTTGQMTLAETRPIAGIAPQQARAVAAALEAHSEHPIARAFSPYRDVSISAEAVINRPGQGLEGRIEGRRWRIGKPAFVAGSDTPAPPDQGRWLLLACDGRPSAWFALKDDLRDDAPATVQALKRLGLSVELLSGDQRGSVEALAQRLGIEDWRAGASPEDKLAHVQALQAQGESVVMVGDGINDVPVLAGAEVSIAMNGATDLARTRADAVLLSPHLSRIVEAIEVSRATRRIIRQNLGWALCYNLTALPLAACGLIPPWLAAIGMSASSLVVVGNALRLGRPRRSVLSEVTTPLNASTEPL
jgi:Cu2+-exporting ATPase